MHPSYQESRDLMVLMLDECPTIVESNSLNALLALL